MGDGEGVRASGESGILWTDLRRWGDLRLCARLCLSPCRELGRQNCDELAGEFGAEELGDELVEEFAADESGDQGIVMGKERLDLPVPGVLSPHDHDLLNVLAEYDREEVSGELGNTW